MKTDKQIKGANYENLTRQIMLLKNMVWIYKESKLRFDKHIEHSKICGASGNCHQIDIHLQSSERPEWHLICECKNHVHKVNKSLANAFIAEIDDIREKHKDWNVLPVFASNSGFQEGAIKSLCHKKIYPFFLQDVRDASVDITVNAEIKSPEIIFTSIRMADGSVVNEQTLFLDRNSSMPPYNARIIMGYFE